MKRLEFMSVRLLQGLLALLLIATVNFMLVRAAPGDPVSIMAGEAGASDPQFVAQLRQQFGLDQPLPNQLASYLGRVLQLDLGFSYRQQQSAQNSAVRSRNMDQWHPLVIPGKQENQHAQQECGEAHGAHGVPVAQASGQFAIGDRGAAGDAPEFSPDPALEAGPATIGLNPFDGVEIAREVSADAGGQSEGIFGRHE